MRSRPGGRAHPRPLGGGPERRTREESHAGAKGCICISAFKQQESILGCLHFWMKHRLHVRTWGTQGTQGRWLGNAFPFYLSIREKKKYCNTGTILEDGSGNENKIFLQKGEIKI